MQLLLNGAAGGDGGLLAHCSGCTQKEQQQQHMAEVFIWL
jgi:hypothetical protein